MLALQILLIMSIFPTAWMSGRDELVLNMSSLLGFHTVLYHRRIFQHLGSSYLVRAYYSFIPMTIY